ncbi:MAG: hypothetical protein HC930_14500 [Hydrococcus sp. SU_1_0]|nr:hypothetical protein [Hydrococcus sp. SU_1_0]
MVKRFSKLEYALKTLRTPTGTGAAPAAPAGSILKKYQDYAAGSVTLEYPRAADSKQGNILKVSVLPFFFGGGEQTGTIVSLSKRASEGSTIGSVKAACNHVVADESVHDERRGFQPAKATIFDYTGTNTSQVSKITGVKYQAKGGKSFTLPYGASATEKSESAVRKDIITAVKAISTASVSFKSERY